MSFFRIIKKLVKLFRTKDVDDDLVYPDLEVTGKAICEEKVDYSCFEFGDVIFAERNDPYDTRQIPEGHEIGPYIVIKRDGAKYVCLEGTSSLLPDRISRNTYFEIDKKYGLSKDTYFYFYRNRSVDRIIKKLGQLDQDDLKILKKRISIDKLKGYALLRKVNIDKQKIESGDIIQKDNDKYVVVDVDDDKYILCYIKNGIRGFNNFMINGKSYQINLDDFVVETNIDDYKLIDYISKERACHIKNEKKKYENKLESKVIERGCVVEYNNESYYIYGEERDCFLVFNIYSEAHKNLIPIYLNNKKIYADFTSDDTVKKTEVRDHCRLVYCSNKSEMDQVQSKRKTFRKNKKSSKNYRSKQNSMVQNCGLIVEDECIGHTNHDKVRTLIKDIAKNKSSE